MTTVVNTLIRRTVAAVATAAATATLVVAMPADARADVVGPVSGGSNAAAFQRSVDGPTLVDGTVARGDVITITNKISRYAGWLIYWVKDTHPTCLNVVPGTAEWTVGGKKYKNGSEVTSGPGWAMIDAPGANSWQADPLIWTQDYVVGSNCELGPLNSGGVEWGSTYAFESGQANHFVGPMLKVVAGRPSITINPTDAMVANDVEITVRHPEGEPGSAVALTFDGKTGDGCGNLKLDGDRRVTCTWVPKKKGDYTVKAVIGGAVPVTVTEKVHVSDSPAGSLGGAPGLDSGSLYTGSLGGFAS